MAFQAKTECQLAHMSNWHLAKAMPTALLTGHLPWTAEHLIAPGPGQRAPSCSAPHALYSKKGFVLGMTINHKTLGPAESASTIKTAS